MWSQELITNLWFKLNNLKDLKLVIRLLNSLLTRKWKNEKLNLDFGSRKSKSLNFIWKVNQFNSGILLFGNKTINFFKAKKIRLKRIMMKQYKNLIKHWLQWIN